MPICLNSPQSVLQTISAHSGSGGGGAHSGRILKQTLARSRDFNADNRFGIYLRPLGPGWSLIRSAACSTPIRVASADPGATFAPGSQILLGSNAGHPGEVLLGMPPNCRAGSSRFPGLTVSTTVRATIPTPCPKPIKFHDYCAFFETGGTDGKVYAYNYRDGVYINKIGELDLTAELGTFNVTSVQWVPPEWLPADGDPVGTESVSLGSISVTFAASGNTITRGSGSWITDGVQIGDVIRFRSTSSNNVEIVVTDLTALVMTARSFDTIVNEGPLSADILIVRENMVYQIPTELRGPHWIVFGTTDNAIVTWHVPTGTYWVRTNCNSEHGGSPYPLVIPRGYRSQFFPNGEPVPAVIWWEFGYRGSGEPQCPSEQEILLRCSTIWPWNALTVSGAGGAGGGGNHGAFELPDDTLVSVNVDLEDRALAQRSMMHWSSNLVAVSGQDFDGVDTMYRRLGEGSWVEAFFTGCAADDQGWELNRDPVASRWNNSSNGYFTADGRTVRHLRYGYEETTGPGGIFISGPDAQETPLWPEAIAPSFSAARPFSVNPARNQVVLTDWPNDRYLRMTLNPITNDECDLPWIDLEDIPEHTAAPLWMLPVD